MKREKWAAWAIVFAVLVCGVAEATVGGSQATLYGEPDLSSIYVVGHGQAAVAIGYVGWGGAWTAAPNGSQLYAGQIQLTAVSLLSYNSTFTFDLYVATHGWVNDSIVLAPVSATDISVNLPADPNWRAVVLVMDGTSWDGQVATPISLLPNSISDVGGLDILALGIISEMVLVCAAATALGAWVQRRALYAPKFSLLVWGHVIIIAIAAAVLLDFEAVDRTFAGWSPLVYAFAIGPVWFLFILSYFNRAEKAEILQGVARPGGRFHYRRWLVREGDLPNGARVAIKEGWGQWFARARGHHVVLDDGDPSHPAPWSATVEKIRSPTDTKTYDDRLGGRGAGRARAVDDFRVVNPQEDGVALIQHTDTSEPMEVNWPRLVWKRAKEVPAKVAPSGQVLVPAHTKMVWTWPHFTEGSVGALRLADEHYAPAAAVSAHWASQRDLARAFAKVSTDLWVLKANFDAKVQDRVESILTAYQSVVGRPRFDMTDGEADAEAIRSKDTRSLSELLDVRDLPSGTGKAP